MIRRFPPLAAFLAVALLTGCANEGNLRGKVISGERSFVGVVDQHDPRLKGPGIPGAEIRMTSDSGPIAGSTVARSTSNKQGEFSLTPSDQRALIYPAQILATLPGHEDARQTMPLPTSDRRLLVILRPTDAPAGGSN